MNQIHIHIERKVYPDRGNNPPHTAIENLSLSLNEHEFVCLVGPSGCGKTTLLNIIAGLDPEFAGSIEFPLQRTPHLGYVFQEPRLLPWRTVRENLTLALPKKQDPAIIDELLAMTGLSKFQHIYPQRLSLGMSRRVALARAFAVAPDLLLMDEPFVSLDAPTAQSMRELLIQLWSERPHTVLFVTHDLREAIALADRLIFLTPPPATIQSEFEIPLPRMQRTETVIEDLRRKLSPRHCPAGTK